YNHVGPRELASLRRVLELPNSSSVDCIHEPHLPVLRECLAESLGERPSIRWPAHEPIAPPPQAPSDPRSHGGAATGSARSWLESQLNPRLTFESFVVGPSNRFTHAACRAVAARPATVYNPLFVFGGSGLGKTHLLH